jgi:hypothetical protein
VDAYPWLYQSVVWTPTDMRMGVVVPTTNFDGLHVTLTETHRKAAINYKFQSGREPRELED